MSNINRLRELRLRANLTASELGKRTGYAESTITAWERSTRSIKPHIGRKLLGALGLHSLDELYREPTNGHL